MAASPHPTVPFSCLTSSQVLQDDFKIFFMKVVGKLNSVGKMDGELGSKPPPNKFPKSFFRLVAGKMCSMLPKPEYLVLATTKPAPKPKTAETRKSENLPPGVSSDEAVPPAGLSLPKPVRVKKAPPRPLVWELTLTSVHGKVIRIVDKNYGIGVSFLQHGEDGRECEPFQFLFDTFDVYVGDKDCNELGKKLSDALNIGDFVKLNAIRIDSEESAQGKDSANRVIKYMATAMVATTDADQLKLLEIPETAPKITSLGQVTGNKIENFKIVSKVLRTQKLSARETEIITELKSGALLEKAVPSLAPQSEENPPVTIDSDDEITVLEDETEDALDCISEEMKPSDLRKLLMTYIDMVTLKNNSKSSAKIKLEEVRKTSKIDKDDQFVETFLLQLGNKCRTVTKGVKVGHVFVTQLQANMIRTAGVMRAEDLSREPFTEPEAATEGVKPANNGVIKVAAAAPPAAEPTITDSDLISKLTPMKLRKILMSFMQFIDKKTTIEKISTELQTTLSYTKQVFRAVTAVCKVVPFKNGKREGIKLQNIFVSSAWVEKIVEFDWQY